MKASGILKRVGAYIIDLFVVTFIGSAMLYISFINPNYKDYEKYSDKYVDSYTEYVKEPNKDNLKVVIDNSYYLNKYGIIYNVIEEAIVVSYLGIYQYQKNGQTLGKKWQKIKVVNKDGKKASLKTIVLRSMILYNIFFVLIRLISVLIFNSTIFMTINGICEICILPLSIDDISNTSLRIERRCFAAYSAFIRQSLTFTFSQLIDFAIFIYPITALSGERISCDILEVNCPFAAFALSAAASASRNCLFFSIILIHILSRNTHNNFRTLSYHTFYIYASTIFV